MINLKTLRDNESSDNRQVQQFDNNFWQREMGGNSRRGNVMQEKDSYTNVHVERVNYDNNLPSLSPVVNCGSTNDWDYCGADPSFSKHPGDFSDGGKYQCVQEGGSYKWKLVCNQDTKYKSNPLSSIANEICDGTRWRQCVDDLDLTPIYDPNVIITCVGYVAQAHEYNCNNNIDDNNNEKTDEADFDCQKTSIDYYLNTYRYEVTIKVGDAYGTNLKT